jgi:hypothetical protein
MCRSLVTLTAAVALVAAGSLASGRAEAGGSQSAPLKISKTTQIATASAVHTGRHTRHEPITEYSSSSKR